MFILQKRKEIKDKFISDKFLYYDKFNPSHTYYSSTINFISQKQIQPMSIIEGLNTSRNQLFKDQDIQTVKILVQRLSNDEDVRLWRAREDEYRNRIADLQRRNMDLSAQLKDVDHRYRQVSNQLQQEKEMRKQDHLNYQVKIKQIIHDKPAPIYFSPKTQIQRQRSVRVENYSPSRESPQRQSGIRRYETPINSILDVRHSSPTKDQVHRLNSYLIENTTALKLLVEKHNYLLKLRGLGETNRDEELDLIAKSKRAINDRKNAEEAKELLSNSRKRYFAEDNSQSQIENQNNNIALRYS